MAIVFPCQSSNCVGFVLGNGQRVKHDVFRGCKPILNLSNLYTKRCFPK